MKIREHALMWLADGWEPSVMLPSDVLESDEKIQIVEVMLEKIALRHHSENYARFVKIFGLETMKTEKFAHHFFTLDPQVGKAPHPVTKNSGILESVKAIDIVTLKENERGKDFFES